MYRVFAALCFCAVIYTAAVDWVRFMREDHPIKQAVRGIIEGCMVMSIVIAVLFLQLTAGEEQFEGIIYSALLFVHALGTRIVIGFDI